MEGENHKINLSLDNNKRAVFEFPPQMTERDLEFIKKVLDNIFAVVVVSVSSPQLLNKN